MNKAKGKSASTAKRPGAKASALPDYRSQIVVRFRDEIDLPYEMDVARHIKERHAGPWNLLEKKFPGVQINPLITSVKPETLRKWILKAKKMDPFYREGAFFKYYVVSCPSESDQADILNDLRSWKTVKDAYVVNKASGPGVIVPDPDYTDQGYLGNDPSGISSLEVWGIDPPAAGIAGSTGAGISLIDIEKGWTLDHDDLGLSAANIKGGGTINNAGRAHGTSVLGIIGAKVNGSRYVGIAPDATINVVSTNSVTVANAIIESINHLSFGDVLLIEETNTGSYGGSPGFSLPVETTDPEFEAIRLATALGIIVIEPGGNGNDNGTPDDFTDDVPVCLNDFTNGINQEILNPSNPSHFRDSGAIIVSAGRSALSTVTGYEDTHELMPFAPWGDRIDCYAWGENIATLSSDSLGSTDLVTPNFGGTSGAAAIIAGAVLSMQGMAVSEQGFRFSPAQMRDILRDPANGTALLRITGDPFSPYEVLNIHMPDLRKFVQNCLNAYPDLYLRDFVGDNGDAHAGAISASPDIILKSAQLSGISPQDEFGDGSAGIDSSSLNDNAVINNSNYLYARVRNRGGVSANSATVKLYYSVPSTLITPSLMSQVQLLDPVTHNPVIPNVMTFPGPVPVNNETAVTNEYEWIAQQIDTYLHYCFIGIVQDPLDPAPDLTTFSSWTWEQFRKYIRNNNNVTWRNFNMITLPPSLPMPPPQPDPEPQPEPAPEPEPDNESSPGQLPVEKWPKHGWNFIDFISPGLPGRNEVMDLEVLPGMPATAMVVLRMPIQWKKEVFRGSPYVKVNNKRNKGYLPLNPRKKNPIKDIRFKANSRTALRIYIYIPPKLRQKEYLISVRQMLGKEEIGRVSWQLVPPRKKFPGKNERVKK